MDFERILQIGDQARRGEKLSANDHTFVREVVPTALATYPQIAYPSRIRHQSGAIISGAVVRTFVKCAMVLAARRTLGPKYYAKSDFYDRVARDLMLDMTLTHFRHGAPKGALCCAQRTLAIYPVLGARALRRIDCKALAIAVKDMIEERKWRFSQSTNARLIAWSLNEKRR